MVFFGRLPQATLNQVGGVLAVLVDGVLNQKIKVVITASTMNNSARFTEFKKIVIALSQW